MNNFQTILVAIFLAFFVFGVLLFSGLINIGGSKSPSGVTGKIVIWGTLPESEMLQVFNENIPGVGDTFSIEYKEHKPSVFNQKLVEAYALDKGPDIFILPSDMVLQNTSFIYKIPFENYSQKTFNTSFIDGADIFLAKDGILGFPLVVDPLVLYFNKDMLTNESILFPPKSWDELFSLNSKLTKKDKNGNISQSMIALGQYANLTHAKDILSMFLLQSNNPIISIADKGYRLVITDSEGSSESPIKLIVNFFLEFSNPSNESYSWNRSLPNSFEMFTAGRSAFYIGYASELFKIEEINPNLAFDVTMIPQTKGVDIKRTYGKMQSVFISAKTKNLPSAFSTIKLIIDPVFIKELGVVLSLPTATRSILADKPKEAYLSTFYDSAIISRSWLDPNRESTDKIFSEMIENSISNRLSVSESISKAVSQLNLLLTKLYE